MALSPRLIKILPIVGAVVAAITLIWMSVAPGCSDLRIHPGVETVRIADETFYLELAATEPKRIQGLMYRTAISDDGGMLFVFPDVNERAFWMKNCLVDMDILFLDPLGRVTAAHEMKSLPPRTLRESEYQYELRMDASSMGSDTPAQFAIEVQAGTIRRLGVQAGDRIELDLPRLKAAAR